MTRPIKFDKVALHTVNADLPAGSLQVRAYLVDTTKGSTGPLFSGDVRWSERTRTALKELRDSIEKDVDSHLFEGGAEEPVEQEDLSKFLGEDDVGTSI